jgi:uncharacterized membrane protein YadS
MRCPGSRGDRVSTTRVELDEASPETSFTSARLVEYVPGVLLLIAVGVLGKYAQVWWNSFARQHHWTVPDIEYVLWAILIGLVVANTIGLHQVVRPGVLTYQFWLKVGIVALGSRFVLGDIAKLGAASLLQILVDMAVAGTIILLVARAFGLSGKLGSLLAIGDVDLWGVGDRGRQGCNPGWVRWGCSHCQL